MPLETITQNFNIVLRNDDFSNTAIIYNDRDSLYQVCRVGKWIEVVPTALLDTNKKLFIDVSNTIYSIENLNQALRLFIRPVALSTYSSGGSSYLSCNKSGDNNGLPGSTTWVNIVMGTSPIFTSKLSSSSSNYNMVITTVDNVHFRLKEILGDLPANSLTTTFYLSGKFLANQPHIEHINSGQYTIYNNLRLISLLGGATGAYRINDIDYNDLTNGFIMNSYYSNPKLETSTKTWSWDYALFQLNIKYISDIVDLASTYLSYGIPYTRYFVLAKSGNPGTYYAGGEYYTVTNITYSAFEFFLAPVGEAN